MEHKMDFSKVPIGDFYKFYTSKMEFTDILKLLDKAIVGGVMDLPISELPSLMSEYMLELKRNSETLAIAMGSMMNYLNRDDES
jgi:hypothetical protein